MIHHRVREHHRKSGHVNEYYRGHGSHAMVYSGQHHGPLTSRQRAMLPDHDYAVILKDGTRKYPIPDEAHARNALARVSANGSPHEKHLVCRKVHERFPEIHMKHCPMHKDPVVMAEKHVETSEYAEKEARRLRGQGYKVHVRPTVGEAASGFFRGAAHSILAKTGKKEEEE